MKNRLLKVLSGLLLSGWAALYLTGSSVLIGREPVLLLGGTKGALILTCRYFTSISVIETSHLYETDVSPKTCPSLIRF